MLKEARNIIRKIVPWPGVEILGSMVLNANKKGSREARLSGLSAIMKSDVSKGMPVHVTVEPTNYCNLRCPVCETGAGIIKRPRGFIDKPTYETIINQVHGYANTMFLYWMGEPFLSKNVYWMAELAKQADIWTETCTNGELVKPVSLALSSFDSVSFQFGGMSSRTHKIYRINGDWGSTLHKLYNTADIEKSNNLHRSRAGLIVMKHNEDEIQRFADFMTESDIPYELISPCVRTVEQARQYLPEDRKYWIYDEKELEHGRLVPKNMPKNSCPWIYYSTVISWDGTVYPCCRDVDGQYPMGNINEQSLSEIWNDERYREFRHRINTDKKSVSICKLCSGFGVPLLH